MADVSMAMADVSMAGDDLSDVREGKRRWTKEEDQKLCMAVNECMREGGLTWIQIAERIPGRKVKQCRHRWTNHLDPNLNKGGWTHDEDTILAEAQKRWGNAWTKIATLLPGRAVTAVKNRCNSKKFAETAPPEGGEDTAAITKARAAMELLDRDEKESSKSTADRVSARGSSSSSSNHSGFHPTNGQRTGTNGTKRTSAGAENKNLFGSSTTTTETPEEMKQGDDAQRVDDGDEKMNDEDHRDDGAADEKMNDDDDKKDGDPDEEGDESGIPQRKHRNTGNKLLTCTREQRPFSVTADPEKWDQSEMVLLGHGSGLSDGLTSCCVFSGKPCCVGRSRTCAHCGGCFFPKEGGLDSINDTDDVFCSRWCAGRNEVVQSMKEKKLPPGCVKYLTTARSGRLPGKLAAVRHYMKQRNDLMFLVTNVDFWPSTDVAPDEKYMLISASGSNTSSTARTARWNFRATERSVF